MRTDVVTAQDAYFGWSQPAHRAGCQRPAWQVATRLRRDDWRGGNAHTCEACEQDGREHGDRYETMTVRLVCESCGAVRLIGGESELRDDTTTATIGYGARPRKVKDVWLYPGPVWSFDTQPHDFLVTRERVDWLEPEHVVGYVAQGTGPRRGVRWGAAALPTITRDDYRSHVMLDYAVKSGDVTFRTSDAAAKWVAAQVLAAEAAEPRRPAELAAEVRPAAEAAPPAGA